MEEAKKRVFITAFTFFIIVGVIVHVTHLNQIQCVFTGDLRSIIQGMLGGGCSVSVPAHHRTAPNAVSPDLTRCHKSVPRPGLVVDCCPPTAQSEEPFTDFKFPDPSMPMRVRLPAHRAGADHIAKYKKALSIMKSLPLDDPRSFIRQANLHCLFCTGAYNQKNPDHHPLSIHQTWLFFPWHRMMLYFHERILGSLIGDDTFALPYWNWDDPEGMAMPEMYMDAPFADQQRDASHLPPQLADLNYKMVESWLGPEEQIELNLALMYNQMVSGAKKIELFMGCPYKAGDGGACVGRGTVETAPHNTMHSWVGSNLNPGREHMGSFYSAARDPIFYPHHSNMDRLWEVWRGFHGRNRTEILDPDWLDSYFFFHNEKTELVRIRVRDVLDTAKLGFVYSNVDLAWLKHRPKPSVRPRTAHHILKMQNHENGLRLPSTHYGAEFGRDSRALSTSIRAEVYRPKTHRTKREREEEEEVLIVYGIKVEGNNYVRFDVFVNLVDERKADPRFREYAGMFVNYPRDARLSDAGMRQKTSIKLGISELLEDLEADEEEVIWVTLLPRTQTCANTTVDGIRIEYMG